MPSLVRTVNGLCYGLSAVFSADKHGTHCNLSSAMVSCVVLEQIAFCHEGMVLGMYLCRVFLVCLLVVCECVSV